DRAGHLWIGFSWGGLARYRDGRFSYFTTDDGVPAGWIYDLYVDHAGRLWIASTLGGLARLDDPSADRPTFITYTTADGLSSNKATSSRKIATGASTSAQRAVSIGLIPRPDASSISPPPMGWSQAKSSFFSVTGRVTSGSVIQPGCRVSLRTRTRHRHCRPFSSMAYELQVFAR
ncbi:MAG: hypothetical protein HY314_14215, partial [Acidobacteria bacterium]|nr:hypothetical protein [Acidobacteriota bacterium]